MTNRTETELAERIDYLNRSYWENGEQEVEDAEYDALMRELEAISPAHPLLNAIHGATVTSSGNVRLSHPMLSLDKAYSLPEVLTWANKFKRTDDERLLVQPKYDGISAVYENGILATRGDGFLGENISDKIPLIRLEAKNYTGPLDRPVRGELLIRADEFHSKWQSKIRKKDGAPYRNPRNAIAGILGLDNITVIQYAMQLCGAFLSFVDYNKYSWSVSLHEFETQWDTIRTQIEALPYPMDGIVIKLADSLYAEALGATAHHPRGQIAFKFTNLRRISKVIGIEWQFGKNCITPVAKIEPVEIGGTTIRSATLHNVQNVIDKDIQIGDTVTVERAGDVIPYIVECSPGTNRIPALIEYCPACKMPLSRRGPELICPNSDCPGTRLPKLAAAIKTVGIEDLGKATIAEMIDRLHVRTLKDIFSLTVADILSLPGFATLSAEKLFAEINAAKTVGTDQILAALNIPGIGQTLAKKILIEHPLPELRTLDVTALSAIFGIGPERAKLLCTALKEQSDTLDELLGCVNAIDVTAEALPSICFTGKMPNPRPFYEALAKRNGYLPVSEVNQTLKLLVTADVAPSSSKLQKALKLTIPTLSLSAWLAQLSVPPVHENEHEFTQLDLF